MRTEAIRVAIRPRGILECLDLAVLFCGRRPLAVAMATALGAVPCILVNRLAFTSIANIEEGLYAAVVMHALEAAWAAVPLTLYLGQSVFSDRFSWRAAARAFVGSLPAMIIFQGLIRSICVGSFVGTILLVLFYYLDQIIVLERPPLNRVWRRRRAVHQGQGFGIVSLAALDILILTVGTVLGTRFLGAVARLWNGDGVAWGSDLEDIGVVAALFSWHGQIAFWTVSGFLTVVRFFTYLDTRIRREGWDVELKLRAEETYAGLPRTTSGRSRLGAAALLAAAVLAATAGTVRAAAIADESGSARQALSRQSFPWYDSAADRFRPLIRAEPPLIEPTASSAPPAERPALPQLTGAAGTLLMTTLLVGAVAAIVFLLVRHGLGDPRHDETVKADAADIDDSSPVPLPAGIRLADGDPLARAAAAAASGDFSSAAVLFHAWMLVELDRRGDLTLARGKTNGQYRTEVATSAPAVAELFVDSCRLFEEAFFGRLPVARSDFMAAWARRPLVTGVFTTTTPTS